MPEFDLHAAIKELAEARRRCPQGSIANKGDADEQWLCAHSDHGYTGYYAPFASLRVACNGGDIKGPHYHHSMYYNPSTGKPCNKSWVPEPDVRVACMEIIEELVRRGYRVSVYADGPGDRADISKDGAFITGWSDGFGDAAYDPLAVAPYDPTVLEAVIRAAQAWLKEQYDTHRAFTPCLPLRTLGNAPCPSRRR